MSFQSGTVLVAPLGGDNSVIAKCAQLETYDQRPCLVKVKVAAQALHGQDVLNC